MPVKIKFLGGVRTVTGSSHLVLTSKANLLLDCGLFQGRRQEFYHINTALHFNPRKLKAMILSHAHIDHCGNIPTLIKLGMRCKIYTTSATKDLCKLMLEDSGKVQEEDARYVNKINRRLNLPQVKPLYTMKEASKAIRSMHPVFYGKRINVAKAIDVTLHNAGHILGSGIIVMDIKEEDRHLRLGYAVDLGRRDLPLLNDPVVPDRLDYLIVESTYGGRLHAPIEDAKVRLKEVINRTAGRGGKIIIPSFTLERAQEVIYFLNELLKEKAIPSIPIYVDSPLATDITDIFRSHLKYLDEASRKAINRGESPFDFLNLVYIRSQQDSKTLNVDKRPMIIIAGSGMCESGRILHHLKNNIEDSRNTVLVVGYMAQDTLGKRIVDKVRVVRIFGVAYELNAEVAVINAFSGHADKDELMDFILECRPLKRVFLVHGDIDQAQALSDALAQKGLNAYMPVKDEEVELD